MRQKTSWARVWAASGLVSALGLLLSLVWQAHALGLLFGLFLLGVPAGLLARRQGWLCGLVVGFPITFFQLTRHVMLQEGSLGAVFRQPDYWMLIIPTCVAATGLAVLGGMAGAWMHDSRWQK